MTDRTLSRRQSRRKAFELLFELEQHPAQDIESILERTFNDPEVKELYLEDPDSEGYVAGKVDATAELFISELVRATKSHEQELDRELEKYPHDWSFDRIGVPERVLLRLALAEIIYLGTSYKVVINEALDLTKLYAQDQARKFINGILGSAVTNLDRLREKCRGEGEDQ